MFSQKAEVDKIHEFREGFVAGTDIGTFVNIINNYYRNETHSYKNKRHMLRLALEAKGILHHGKFNPTLSRVEIALISSLAELPMEHVYNDAMALAGF
jgi:hypothetical protein